MTADRRECTNPWARPQGLPPAAVTAIVALVLTPVHPSASSVEAQIIRGMVVEATGRAPIGGAVVELRADRDGGKTQATSDSLGLFVLRAPRAGSYTLGASRLGYLKYEGDTIRLGSAESVSIEIRLDTRVVPLEPLVVMARSGSAPEGFEARRAGGFGRFLTRKDIDARSAPHTTDLFRAMPGVVITAQRRGPGSSLQMRGTTGLCAPAVWIDGLAVPIYAGTNIDDLLMPTVIEAIEVYNSVSSAPIQYRSGSCGVVLFWTRRGSGAEGGRVSWWKVALGVGAAAGFILLLR
jgi:hypothetical protein